MSATAPLATHRTSILIYFLTVAEDEEVCNAIRRHLIPIVRESEIPIELMDDFDAPPGSERTRHQERLLTADIVISLISVDFLDDDTLYKRNQQVIERHNLGQTVMMSILVRNCMWKVTPFAKLRVLPKNHEPLNNKKYWNSEDDALASVAGDIYTSISEITNVVVLPQGPVPAVGGSTGAESVADEPAAAPVGQSDAVAAEPRPVEAPSQPRPTGRRPWSTTGRPRPPRRRPWSSGTAAPVTGRRPFLRREEGPALRLLRSASRRRRRPPSRSTGARSTTDVSSGSEEPPSSWTSRCSSSYRP